MDKVDDFERVGDLLGDACDAAASADAQRDEGSARSQRRSAASSRGDTKGTATRTAGKAGKIRHDAARVLAQAWAEIAGPDVAANTRPVQLKRGRLVVSASSSGWAHALQDMGEDLKERLNERVGRTVVQKIVFRHAGWEERPGEENRPESTTRLSRETALSEEQAEALAQLDEVDLPAGLRDRIARAMKAAFVRGQQDSVR
jgi:predicted nucleic acid-binding Zn ribbon protein